ncbi:MAG: glycosyltransferase [Sphaerochaeta sp.]|nr:glycosyltransferase [Sphaerochaeta sp.]
MTSSNTTRSRIKVLYVVESFSTGVYSIIKDIACNLDPDQFELLILYSLREDSPKNPEADFRYNHITMQYVPMGSLKNYVPAVKAIRSAIKQYQPDSIHVHSSKAGFLGRLAAKGLQKKVLYSPHGFSFLRTDVSALKRWIFFQLEFWINRYLPSKIIAVSEGEYQHALRITKNSIVINNFIDLAMFQKDDCKPSDMIVTCGRITAARNPALFNSIAKALPNYAFMWIGDGPQRNTIDAPNIIVTGLLPRKDAVKHVKNACIYVQTSLWEGMPVSVLEAMAAGKPVVASNIVGNRDIIKDGMTGYLCDASSVDQFVARIKELLSSEESRTTLGANARSYVEAHHDVQKAIAAYQANYKSM